MAWRPLRAGLIAPILCAACACASTRMSTRDIYAEIAFGDGMVCTPVAAAREEQRQDERLHERMTALRPFLIAQIGEAEMRRMHADYDAEMGSVDFIGCPTAEQHSHRRTRRWMLLHELENRARATPLAPAPSGGRS